MTEPTKKLNEQEFWFALIHEHGEPKARRILSDALKKASENVLTKNYPDVYGCSIWPKEGSSDFIFHVGVTLSYPWPG